MKKNSLFILLIPAFFSPVLLPAQTIKVEKDALYGSKINVPVTIEVENKQLSYEFYAYNKSFYPYTVHLEIMDIDNLTPARVDRRFNVKPGRSLLIELKVQDGSRRSSYRHNYTYAIGVKGGKVDPLYPYLIPVQSGFSITHGEAGEGEILPNLFRMNMGDTVFAARRGKICATPDMFDGTDRVSQNHAVEILQNDGTIMVYENIDPEAVFVKAGNQVLPGQPIGLLDKNAFLKLILYQSTGDGSLEAIGINYFLDEEHIEPFSDRINQVPVVYPVSIITKEFKKRELKLFEQGEKVF